jgi:hypothetical protein
VRNIVASKAYADLFDVHLAEDSSAANRWHTQKGGMYAAAGVGTATTGRGAHVFLIDDHVELEHIAKGSSGGTPAATDCKAKPDRVH